MTEFLYHYGLFTAKTATLVIAILVLVGGVALISAIANKKRTEGQLRVRSLNHRFQELRSGLEGAVQPKRSWRQRRAARKEQKAALPQKPRDKDRPRVFVLDFRGDLRASAVDELRTEVSAVKSVAREGDEVVVRLESPGGVVPAYGLAASQLKRLRDADIQLTVAVDKVAASGGYLMACVAHRVLAAPFAIIGSIGVVAEIPNIHRALKSREIDVEQFTAGEYKRTVTLLGETTEAGRAKLQEELDEVHTLFKGFVAEHRPDLDVERVATGEYWYGTRALDVKLVDELTTSDDYLLTRAEDCDVFEVHYATRRRLMRRLREAARLVWG
ncbi:MAG: protease SohB [Candidatus Competibacterales bacterium]